jgi:hypothetical protein
MDRRDSAAQAACRLRQEWEAELRHREVMLADWYKLNWRSKLTALAQHQRVLDALWMQTYRWEDG